MDPRSLQNNRFYVAVFQLRCVQMTVILVDWQQKGDGRCFTGVRVLLQPRGGCCCFRAALRACSASSALPESEETSHPQEFFWHKGRRASPNYGWSCIITAQNFSFFMGLALVSSRYLCHMRSSCPRMAPGFHLSLVFCAQKKEFTSYTHLSKIEMERLFLQVREKKKKRKK